MEDQLNKFQLLIVDDQIDTLEALKAGLSGESFQILTVASRNQAINVLKNTPVDIIITDLKLKDGSGLDLIKFVNESTRAIPIIVITAYGSIETAVEAIRSGAYDYLLKPFKLADLKRILNRLIEILELKRENQLLRERLFIDKKISLLIGVSPKFRQIHELIKQVAPSRSTVLITGETGTGKELVATAIHAWSNRQDKAFVKINCGAIPENLLEAELFGYEKGAFTGAYRQKKGKVEWADGGTLFLDEIGDLPLTMQVKLLRVLQNGEFERLGDTTVRKVDVRFVAATNVDLEERVAAGLFREDLYYRLNVIKIHLPPLRERLEDIPYLIQFFIEKFNEINNKKIQGIEPEVLRLMQQYPWKGNIRELENMVERAVVLCQEDILQPKHFPLLYPEKNASQKKITIDIGASLAEIERKILQQTLRYYQNDKQKTAMVLQIGLATLYRKIKEYRLE